MKRLVWLTIGLLIGAAAVWVMSRSQMDGLYAEISRMREQSRNA